MQQVTDSYILGIKEGRNTLKNHPELSPDDIRREIDSCTRLMRSYSQPMKDVFKGQRDFWRNQLKKRG